MFPTRNYNRLLHFYYIRRFHIIQFTYNYAFHFSLCYEVSEWQHRDWCKHNTCRHPEVRVRQEWGRWNNNQHNQQPTDSLKCILCYIIKNKHMTHRYICVFVSLKLKQCGQISQHCFNYQINVDTTLKQRSYLTSSQLSYQPIILRHHNVDTTLIHDVTTTLISDIDTTLIPDVATTLISDVNSTFISTNNSTSSQR